MNTVRPCGCKGCRTCLICEKEYNLPFQNETNTVNKSNSHVYCPFCNKIYPGWNMDIFKEHPNHIVEGKDFNGVYIQIDFLTDAEEAKLVKDMDSDSWQQSQCGRRKQNFGPKCNFNKRKLKLGEFKGFPAYTKFIQDKFKSVLPLSNFQTIEQCAIEYDPSRGAWIPPHIDDCWVWGNRIISVNLISDSVLTLTLNSKPNSYNLADLPDKFLLKMKSLLPKGDCTIKDLVVRIPMPRKSLLILFDNARYNWEHQILREDIKARRICLAYREFTQPYLENDHLGIIKNAHNFLN